MFLVENTKARDTSFINLRPDYGSTWEGEIIILYCEYTARTGAYSDAVLINGSNSGWLSFRYACYMPEKVTIDGHFINDANPVSDYKGPKYFASFNSAYINERYKEKYPYTMTQKEVEINNLKLESGRNYILSNNPFLHSQCPDNRVREIPS